MIERRLVSRIWFMSTMMYLAAYLGALGFASDWTFKSAASPFGELLAAPICFSFGGLGIRVGIVSWVGAEIERSKHPVSFWVTTILIFFLGLLFLVVGLHGLFSREN